MFMIFLWKMFCKRSDLFIGWGVGDGGMGFCRSFVQLLLDGLKDFWRAFDIHSFVFIVFFRKQF